MKNEKKIKGERSGKTCPRRDGRKNGSEVERLNTTKKEGRKTTLFL